jgi:hypothetical protein
MVLHLGDNTLRDTIPGTLANCSSLRLLNLCGNFLFGGIPPVVSALSNLLVFRLQRNNLTGVIPPPSPLATSRVSNLSFQLFEY